MLFHVRRLMGKTFRFHAGSCCPEHTTRRALDASVGNYAPETHSGGYLVL